MDAILHKLRRCNPQRTGDKDTGKPRPRVLGLSFGSGKWSRYSSGKKYEGLEAKIRIYTPTFFLSQERNNEQKKRTKNTVQRKQAHFVRESKMQRNRDSNKSFVITV